MGLNVVSAGSVERGVMVGITGQAGAGKTTLAATFPNPLVLDLEGGSFVLSRQGTSVHREWASPSKGRLQELRGVLREVAKTDFRTVVIDSWTRLSDWIEKDILEEDGSASSLMSAFGGFGKGRDAHVSRTMEVIDWLQKLQEHRKMNVVLVLHTKLGVVDLPSGESYSHFGTEGVKDSTKRVFMACDEVAMLRQKVVVVSKDKSSPGKAKGKGERELFRGSAPYCDVKSRFCDEPHAVPVLAGTNPLADILPA